jgi:hypothetical protein
MGQLTEWTTPIFVCASSVTMVLITVSRPALLAPYDVLVAVTGVPPDVLICTDDQHVVEPSRVVDQDPLALG